MTAGDWIGATVCILAMVAVIGGVIAGLRLR